MLSTIENYKQEFTKTLNLYKHPTTGNDKTENIKEKEEKLSSITSSFFQQKQITTQWKEFPASKLTNTKYSGHQVRFFTMQSDIARDAETFFTHLKEKGANVELKQVGNSNEAKPSLVVDLTASTFKS